MPKDAVVTLDVKAVRSLNAGYIMVDGAYHVGTHHLDSHNGEGRQATSPCWCGTPASDARLWPFACSTTHEPSVLRPAKCWLLPGGAWFQPNRPEKYRTNDKDALYSVAQGLVYDIQELLPVPESFQLSKEELHRIFQPVRGVVRAMRREARRIRKGDPARGPFRTVRGRAS